MEKIEKFNVYVIVALFQSYVTKLQLITEIAYFFSDD